MAAGRTGTDFSFWDRSPSGSGVCRRIESVKLPWVTVRGAEEGEEEEGAVGLGSGGSVFGTRGRGEAG